MGILFLRSSVASGGGGADWWEEGQLAAGHFDAAYLDALVVYPRPDAETSARAPHRNAYYDGVNPVQYQIPLGVIGGAAPWMFHLVSGPPGASIPEPFYRGIDENGDTIPYGWVEWDVDQAYTSESPAEFVVLARDQEGTEVTIEWSTVAGTDNHLFVSRDSGNDSNDGSYGSPFQTLNKVLGTSAASTTNPDKQIWIRGSATAYSLSAHASGSLAMDGTRKPVCIRSFPGEDVEIDMSATILRGSNAGDFGFMGSVGHRLTLTGSCTVPADSYVFWFDDADRAVFWRLWFKNPVSKAEGTETNSTAIHTGSWTRRNHWLISDCLESGRTNWVGTTNPNFMLLCSLFSVDNSLIEFCKATQDALEDSTQGITLKDTNFNCTVRFCTTGVIPDGMTGSGWAMRSLYQNGGGDNEYIGCFLVGGHADLNAQGDMDQGQGHHVGRCTIYASDFQVTQAIVGVVDPGGARTFTSSNCVLVARVTAVTDNVTDTGSITYLWNGDGTPGGTNTPIDPSTGRLRNITSGTQYRTLYEGTSNSKGHVFG